MITNNLPSGAFRFDSSIIINCIWVEIGIHIVPSCIEVKTDRNQWNGLQRVSKANARAFIKSRLEDLLGHV